MKFLNEDLKAALDDIVESNDPENFHHMIATIFSGEENDLEGRLRQFAEDLSIDDAINYQMKLTLLDFKLDTTKNSAIQNAAALLMETLLPSKIRRCLEEALDAELRLNNDNDGMSPLESALSFNKNYGINPISDEDPYQGVVTQANFPDLVMHICAKHPDFGFEHFRQVALAKNHLLAAFNMLKETSLPEINEIPLIAFSNALDAAEADYDDPLEQFVDSIKSQEGGLDTAQTRVKLEEYLGKMQAIDPDFKLFEAQRAVHKSLAKLESANTASRASDIFSSSQNTGATESPPTTESSTSVDQSP